MATVIMKRGTNADMENTPSLNGLIFFNTDDKCIYLDNGTTRTIFGGKIPMLSVVSNNDGASDNNVYSAKAVKNNFCIKSNVADSASNINNTTDTGRPVGCVGFKAIVGTSNISAVDTTVTGAISKINNRLVVDNTKFVFDYQDGKWGFNTSDERGADTFHPFNSTVLTMNTTASSYTNKDIISSNIYLTISSTTDSNGGALSSDLRQGTCATAITSRSYKTASNKYVKGGIIHAFYDLDGGTTEGNHRHYMYLDNAWRYDVSNNTPISNVIYSHPILGLPFSIPTINSDTSVVPTRYYRDDIVYYYVCYLKDAQPYIDIYKYVPSLTNGYEKGSWNKIYTSLVDVESTSTDITSFKIGSTSTIVVYHGDLYIIDGTLEINNISSHINAIYKWSPRTNTMIKLDNVDYPSDLINAEIIKAIVHNDKIYIFYHNTSGYFYVTYNNGVWSSSQQFYHFNDLNIDNQSQWIEYNGSIHVLGGSVSENRNQHISINDTNMDNSTPMAVEAIRYKYANLKYPFRSGCVCTAPPVVVSNADSSEYANEIEDAKYLVPQYIHYMGTIHANTSSAAYRRMHRKIIDTYQADVCNAYGRVFNNI